MDLFGALTDNRGEQMWTFQGWLKFFYGSIQPCSLPVEVLRYLRHAGIVRDEVSAFAFYTIIAAMRKSAYAEANWFESEYASWRRVLAATAAEKQLIGDWLTTMNALLTEEMVKRCPLRTLKVLQSQLLATEESAQQENAIVMVEALLAVSPLRCEEQMHIVSKYVQNAMLIGAKSLATSYTESMKDGIHQLQQIARESVAPPKLYQVSLARVLDCLSRELCGAQYIFQCVYEYHEQIESNFARNYKERSADEKKDFGAFAWVAAQGRMIEEMNANYMARSVFEAIDEHVDLGSILPQRGKVERLWTSQGMNEMIRITTAAFLLKLMMLQVFFQLSAEGKILSVAEFIDKIPYILLEGKALYSMPAEDWDVTVLGLDGEIVDGRWTIEPLMRFSMFMSRQGGSPFGLSGDITEALYQKVKLIIAMLAMSFVNRLPK